MRITKTIKSLTLSVAVAGLLASSLAVQAKADPYDHDRGGGGHEREWQGHDDHRGMNRAHDEHRYRSMGEHDWHQGRWTRGVHDGRRGWWWVVDGMWYNYPAPVYPYPANPYAPNVVYAPPVVQAPPPPPPGFNLIVPLNIR